uniref:Uncharacterized protein n=1 Tax=Tetranychus urticae TaxID=32264 RepID=A0A158P5F3_TETUR
MLDGYVTQKLPGFYPLIQFPWKFESFLAEAETQFIDVYKSIRFVSSAGFD